MAKGRKTGQGRGIPNPNNIADPEARQCLEAVIENILYLLSKPDSKPQEPVYVLEGTNIMVEQLGDYTFRINASFEDLEETRVSVPIGTMIYADGVLLPEGAVGEVSGTVKITDSANKIRIIPKVKKPTADNLNPALVMFAKESIKADEIGEGGSAYDDDLPDILFDPDGDTLETGDQVGSVEDEWFLTSGNRGFIALGEQIEFPDGSDRIKVRPEATGYSYPGPFKVVQKDDTNITVEGYNVTEDRKWQNYIDIGVASPLELEEQDIEVLVTGWVYLVLTQTANVYDPPTIATAVTLPAQDNEHVYIRLAYVTVTDGVISDVLQWWYGGIALPGRVF